MDEMTATRLRCRTDSAEPKIAVPLCARRAALRASDVGEQCGSAKQYPADDGLGSERHDERTGDSTGSCSGEPVALTALPVELLVDFPEFRRLQVEANAPLGDLLTDVAEDRGEFAKRLTQLRQVFANVFQYCAPAHLLVHPLSEHGMSGFPQVELGIELPAKPFDVEECFVQQDHLRLNLNVEALRDAEQAHQDLGE